MTTINQRMSFTEVEQIIAQQVANIIETIDIYETKTSMARESMNQGNETLIVRGDGSDRGNETRLNIISCTKTQKYMLKGCHVFLAHVTTKKTEDKSEGKRLEDVPIVRDFPEVFLEDLPGLPPTRQVITSFEYGKKIFQKRHSKLVWSLRVPSYAIWFDECTGGIYGYHESGFSKIAKSMTKLTQKKVKFVWGDKQEAAFQLLKQKLCSAPILALPEGSEDFIVYCDASIKGLGAMLMQREKVIAYASRQLKIH
ncbi:putative reverse transcriptase domain-containing protein [Tanacetum coccineum]